MNKKIIALILVVAFAFGIAVNTKAATIEELTDLVAVLQAQLAALQGNIAPVVGLPAGCTSTTGFSTTTGQSCASVVEVKLFTMSFCPFGNQTEYNLLPVIKLLKDSVDIVPHYIVSKTGNGTKLENYSSMRGVTELKQDVRELCVYKYDKAKYWDFVDAINRGCTNTNVDTCWLKIAESAGLDINKIETCLINEGPALLAKEVAANTEYNAHSSPLLFINKVSYQGARTPELYKTAICRAFTDAKKPVACATKLQETDATNIILPLGCTLLFGFSPTTGQSCAISPVIPTIYNLRDVGPAGGLIFYDKGSYSDGWRYLEAAPYDQSAKATWGCYGTAISGSDGLAIGTGRQNTLDMIAAGCKNAAQLCSNLVINGYNDWFLPSKDELAQLYANRIAIEGFPSSIYWSSSEKSANYAWLQGFYDGSQINHDKHNTLYVRAIRAF